MTTVKTDVMSAEEAQRLKTDARLAREFADVKDREAAWIALELAEAQQERDALRAQLAQVTAERDALRSIVEGRTAPPTWQEIERHHESGGSWMASAGGVADVSEHASVTRHWADDHRELPDMGGCRWWPLDTHGRPCAWPVVDR